MIKRGNCLRFFSKRKIEFPKAFKFTAVNEEEEFYDFFIVKRIDINYVDTTKYLDEIFWKKNAQTTDGKTFTRF